MLSFYTIHFNTIQIKSLKFTPKSLTTLKVQITTAADDNFDFFYFSEKTSLDISCESSAKQSIHISIHFSEKKKKVYICLLENL